MNTFTTENLKKAMESFDFNLLFNNSESNINYAETQNDFMFPETTVKLEGMRKWKNDAQINYIKKSK